MVLLIKLRFGPAPKVWQTGSSMPIRKKRRQDGMN